MELVTRAVSCMEGRNQRAAERISRAPSRVGSWMEPAARAVGTHEPKDRNPNKNAFAVICSLRT